MILGGDQSNAQRRKELSAVKDSDSAFLRQLRMALLAVALPFVMAVGPVAGYMIGGWIGESSGHGAGGRLMGLVLGAAASVYQTILIIRRILREMK